MNNIFLQFSVTALLTIHAQAATAQDNFIDAGLAAVSSCRADHVGAPRNDACFGRVVELCLIESPDSAVIPRACWEAELGVWDKILNTTYQTVISDMNTSGHSEFVPAIRSSQRHWLEQVRLDCALEVMSNPRTYDVLSTACHAHTTMERGFFLQNLIGADWTPL